MKLKRLAGCLLCLLILAMLPMTVSAERPESMDVLSKQYILHITPTRGEIEANPISPAFWEYPLLRAGEDYAEGTMIVRNDSEYVASMELTEITLPYGDAKKLAYLDHLELTVTEGDTVLYDNTYAHINDEEGGLKLVFNEMQPGEEHIYTIKLRCRYDYAGDPYADVAQVAWLFGASTKTVTYEESAGLPEWAKMTVMIFAAMVVLLLLIVIVRAIVRAVKKKA